MSSPRPIRGATLTVLLSVSLAGTACSPIGGEVGDPTDPPEMPALSRSTIDVASCSLVDATVSCSWGDEESLIGYPIDLLQASMSLWVKADERVEPVSNDEQAIIYDLAATSWEPGDRVLIKTQLTAEWDDQSEILSSLEFVFEAEQVIAGIDLPTGLEVWELAVIGGGERNVVAEFGFSGIMSLDEIDLLLEKDPYFFTLVVDPATGVAIETDGELAIVASEPGYYRFEDARTASLWDANESLPADQL